METIGAFPIVKVFVVAILSMNMIK